MRPFVNIGIVRISFTFKTNGRFNGYFNDVLKLSLPSKINVFDLAEIHK